MEQIPKITSQFGPVSYTHLRYPVDVTKLKKSEPKLYEEGKVNEENMKYLKKLITFCKENDIEFVAVTTPIPINTLKDYSDSYNCLLYTSDSVMESSCICGQVKIPHRTMIYLERELAPMEELYKDREKSGGIL